jgi:hypothetical protein
VCRHRFATFNYYNLALKSWVAAIAASAPSQALLAWVQYGGEVACTGTVVRWLL